MLELGKTFVLAGKHELDMPVPAGKLPIYLHPGYVEDYLFKLQRNDFLALLAQLSLSGKSVLDVGTGAGFVAIVCARLGASPVCAIELYDHPFEHARANFTLNKLPITLVRKIPDLAPMTFDFVLNNEAHLPSYLTLLKDMASATKPEGSIILETDPDVLNSHRTTDRGIPCGIRLLESAIDSLRLKIVKKHKMPNAEFWEVKHA